MKHRSVIAFVIVAAALFALPQLSHDLQALKGAVGARLHRELLHAFLNLPAGEPAAAAPAERPAATLLASCPTQKSGGDGVKGRRGTDGGRPERRASEKTFEQRAMIGDPVNDPIGQRASADVKEVEALLPEVKVEAEVAMIIPPESGIDPRALSNVLASRDAARAGAGLFRAEAEGLRVSYAAATRLEALSPEWQKATEEAVRRLNDSRPGTYEFRLVRDGAKGKVLKFRCAECPAPTPRAPRAPRQVAVGLPLPAPVAPAETAGE